MSARECGLQVLETKHTIGLSVLVLDEGCDETLGNLWFLPVCKHSGVGEKEPFKHVSLFYGVDLRLSENRWYSFMFLQMERHAYWEPFKK